MPKKMHTTKRVPAVLIWNGTDSDIPSGTTLEVRKAFFRNGEGWARLTDGRELPDVFLADGEA